MIAGVLTISFLGEVIRGLESPKAHVESEDSDRHGRASLALSSHVCALIFVVVPLFLCLLVNEGHNRFAVAGRIVDSPGRYAKAFLLLLRAAFEIPDGDGDDQDDWLMSTSACGHEKLRTNGDLTHDNANDDTND